MATYLDTIFNKFLSQIDDIELGLLSDEDIEELLIGYLENATIEFKECKKDLTIVKPVVIEKWFEGEGDTLSMYVTLKENSRITVKDKDREYELDVDYTYTYDDITEELQVVLLNPSVDEVAISIREEGFINDDLTLEEIFILSLSMRLFWLDPKIHREENLRQMMNDRDFTQLSNANMLKALLSLHTATRQELQKFKQRYAFNDFKGFD